MSREKFLEKKINMAFITVMLLISMIVSLVSYMFTGGEKSLLIIVGFLIWVLIPSYRLIKKDMKELEDI